MTLVDFLLANKKDLPTDNDEPFIRTFKTAKIVTRICDGLDNGSIDATDDEIFGLSQVVDKFMGNAPLKAPMLRMLAERCDVGRAALRDIDRPH